MDFIHVPILPLNSAFLAARTGAAAGERDSYDKRARGAPSPAAGLALRLGRPGRAWRLPRLRVPSRNRARTTRSRSGTRSRPP